MVWLSNLRPQHRLRLRLQILLRPRRQTLKKRLLKGRRGLSTRLAIRSMMHSISQVRSGQLDLTLASQTDCHLDMKRPRK
jgi:hypothetical protein